MADTAPDFITKEVESFCFHLHFIYKGKTKLRSAILKKFEKFVQPTNENFTTFCKKHVYESCRTLFPLLILMKLKDFAFLYTVSIRGKLNLESLFLKCLKNLFDPQMKISQCFATKSYMSHGGHCSRF